MSNKGFPEINQNNGNTNFSSIYNDNTRRLFLDINQSNLKIFENIFTRITMLSDEINRLSGKLDDIHLKLENVINCDEEHYNHLMETMNKIKISSDNLIIRSPSSSLKRTNSIIVKK